uniref:Uncharacterized protein n=1 Tax=Anguilla anguilla TaxID=7936 RepID=A0A0E9SYM0_ANGAN
MQAKSRNARPLSRKYRPQDEHCCRGSVTTPKK